MFQGSGLRVSAVNLREALGEEVADGGVVGQHQPADPMCLGFNIYGLGFRV